jgi:hypothetical protein
MNEKVIRHSPTECVGDTAGRFACLVADVGKRNVHLDDEIIEEYARNPERTANRLNVEEHLFVCDTCRGACTEMEMFIDALRLASASPEDARNIRARVILHASAATMRAQRHCAAVETPGRRVFSRGGVWWSGRRRKIYGPNNRTPKRSS